MTHIAILAYGSLIDNPGDELAPLIVERRPIQTHFPVEFARSSQSRARAPTLVPVCCEGIGAQVQAQLLVLRPDVPLTEATNMLYRREIHQVGSQRRYDEAKALRSTKTVRIVRLHGFGGVEVALYAHLPVNLPRICDPNISLESKAECLANLAVASVTAATYAEGKDGIRYLERAIAAGIQTPLTDPYREAILRLTGAATLEEARQFAWQRAAEGHP